MTSITTVYETEEPEAEEKKPAQKPEEAMSERFLKTRTILLSGEIDKEQAERVIRQLLLLESLSDDPIDIYIDSPGGDVDAAVSAAEHAKSRCVGMTIETRPDYVLILPWNLKDEIMQQMAHIREWGGRFVVPIPTAQVLA